MKKALSMIPALFFLLTSVMYGADQSFFSTLEASSQNASSSAITFGYIIQLLFSLAVVFGLIYIGSKYFLPKLQMPSKSRQIEVVDRIGLEPQVTSYIIKAQGSSYLIVVSNKNICRIDKLEGNK